MSRPAPHPASYRDPAGFIFKKDGIIYRCVSIAYQQHYDRLMASGLYERLAAAGLLVTHEAITSFFPDNPSCYCILKPKQLMFHSYPYEWSFEQLRAAALATLDIASEALDSGMILKDATPFNIRFAGGKPLWIDTLSFEEYSEGTPWIAFSQFCRMFLYPLLAMHYQPGLTPAMIWSSPNGLDAAFVRSLLPAKAKFSFNNQMYVYLPARLAGKNAGGKEPTRNTRVSSSAVRQNLAQLKHFIGGLKQGGQKSEWDRYYEETILSDAYLQHKKEVVEAILAAAKPKTVTDLGCNTGAFSLLAAAYAEHVIAIDSDAPAIDRLFHQAAASGIRNIDMLVADISYPSSGTGWNNEEQEPLLARIGGELVLALALVHHLAISRNIPLALILQLIDRLAGKEALVEFIPKEDPKVQLLLRSRKDIFDRYSAGNFEEEAAKHFIILKKYLLRDSSRTVYHLRKKER